jgi:hypothetical protein
MFSFAHWLAGETSGNDPQDHDEQLDPNRGVHVCLHALAITTVVSSMTRR